MYTKPEDEFFHRRAAWSFTFDTPAKGGATDDLQPMRLVMAVTPQQVTPRRIKHQLIGVCPCRWLILQHETVKRLFRSQTNSCVRLHRLAVLVQ